MSFDEIAQQLQQAFTDVAFELPDTKALQPALTLPPHALPLVAAYLHDTQGLYFDFLSCLTALDNGSQKNSLEVLYHLYSIPYHHQFVLRVLLPRNAPDAALPSVPTVSTVWRSALWHEREAYDLVGIHFENHPDLRRILLPEDWEGHPLRKDYQHQDYYHGIRVAY
ncbi:NADH-quinone oxidoreductase subunit C [Eisenibacter elegans]|jgi:NADH-quinone oxidoreductase subunit C|uniref:NADH-quinone oxidoreductase subunit C n=1 Tax=Eisenibacter elegans TaxID=997 RepID=UPI0003F6BB95|nr:NADH-quinone oxidoreductase subunit C [Eisenibacter elegans]